MSESEARSASTSGSTAPEKAAGQQSAWSSPEVSAILSQYGQAMMRLGQLEKELEELKHKVPATATTPTPSSADIQGVMQEKERELRRKDETIASLRLQVSTLTSQLARSEEKLKMAADGNYVAHRRRGRRKWWQFWRRSSRATG